MYTYIGANNQLKLIQLQEAHYIRDNYTEPSPPPADLDFLLQARRVML